MSNFFNIELEEQIMSYEELIKYNKILKNENEKLKKTIDKYLEHIEYLHNNMAKNSLEKISKTKIIEQIQESKNNIYNKNNNEYIDE